MKRKCPAIVSMLGGVLLACWSLPKDFSSLPLDQKVRAYEHRFKMGGARSQEAEDLIEGHGYMAAQAMAPYVRGDRQGIPPFVAVNIIWDVQVRGCDLRHSQAEEALHDLLLRHPQADERLVAEKALEWIDKDRHSSSGPEALPARLCQP